MEAVSSINLNNIDDLSHEILGYIGGKLVLDKFGMRDEHNAAHTGFMLKLDNLSIEIVEAIVLFIKKYNSNIQILIPRSFAAASSTFPSDCISELNSASIRNLNFDEQHPILTAVSGAELNDTMGNICSIGTDDIKKVPVVDWINACKNSKFLNENSSFILNKSDETEFTAALKGLKKAYDSLDVRDFSRYCASVCLAYKNLQKSLSSALGYSLPRIRLPRSSDFFINRAPAKKSGLNRLSDKQFATKYTNLIKERSSYYSRQRNSGELLERSELLNNFENKIKTSVSDQHVLEVMSNYIYADNDDLHPSRELFELEWVQDNVYLLFEKDKAPKEKLGDMTINFFDCTFKKRDLTYKSFQNYLDLLEGTANKVRYNDDDRLQLKKFFDKFDDQIIQNKSLYKKWEKAVYNNKVSDNDFYKGFINAVTELISVTELSKDAKIKIYVKKTLNQWHEFNYKTGCFFTLMYGSFFRELQDKLEIEWSFKKDVIKPLPDYNAFFEAQKKQQKESKSKSKKADWTKGKKTSAEANQIKFEISIHTDNSDEEIKPQIFEWSYNTDIIGLDLYGDLREICKHKKLFCYSVASNPVTKKGQIQTLSLEDVGTLSTANRSGDGSLIPDKFDDKEHDLSGQIRHCIDTIEFNEDTARQQINTILDKFEKAYFLALNKFLKDGLDYELIKKQAEYYAELLRTADLVLNKDSFREKLLPLLLKIGIINIIDDSSVIVTPWHPLRLLALAEKQQLMIQYCRQLLSLDASDCSKDKDLNLLNSVGHVVFTNKDQYKQSIIDDLNMYLSPETAVSINENTDRELVSSSISFNGYSLLEKTTSRINSICRTVYDSNAKKAVSVVIPYIKNYLQLYPYAKNNLSILIYECDSADFPYHLFAALSEEQEEDDDDDIRLSLHIVNTDITKVSEIRKNLLKRIDAERQTQLTHARSDRFISNLIISVYADVQLVVDSTRNGKFDLCILYDVFADRAEVSWVKNHLAENNKLESIDKFSHIPYRYVNEEKDTSSAVYLCSPVQSDIERSYISLVSKLCRRTYDQADNLLPVKIIDITKSDTKLSKIIEKTHQSADWIISYDSLIDRKLLEYFGIKIIRQIKNRSSDHNLIISTRADMSGMDNLLHIHFNELGLPCDDNSLTDQVKTDAQQISGSILLRAARSRNFTCEMLGLVLCRKIFNDVFNREFKKGKASSFAVVYFMLDDLRSWFPTDDNQLADILALGVSKDSCGYKLSIKIAESKYISSNIDEFSTKSADQLVSTVNTFIKAFVSRQGIPCDRDFWLSKLVQLLPDTSGDQKIAFQQVDPGFWAEAKKSLLEGNFQIALAGSSLVFNVSANDADLQRDTSIEDLTDSRLKQPQSAGVLVNQAILSRADVCDIFKKYQLSVSCLDMLHDHNSDDVYYHDIDFVNFESFSGTLQKLCPNWEFRSSFGFKKPDRAADEDKSSAAAPQSHPADKPSSGSAPAAANSNAAQAAAVAVVSGKTAEPDKEQGNAVAGTGTLDAHWPEHISRFILNHPEAVFVSEKRQAWADRAVKKLQRALAGYQMHAQLDAKPILTPNGVSVQFKGSNDLTVDKINRRLSELLTTHSLRISNVAPGPGSITINIAGEERETVSLMRLWYQRKLNVRDKGFNSAFVIGLKENDSQLLYLNFNGNFAGREADSPHTLVAGTSGSGKSVLLNSLILDIAATNSCDRAKLLLIDPKFGVEFGKFNDLPHLLRPVVINKDESAEELRKLVEEMDRRYQLFKQKNVNNISDYNTVVSKQEALPRIFVVHDEFAEWMMDKAYKDEVTLLVGRLGVKARAAGIHLIFAAQRPDKDVIPMQLRANLDNRLILKVDNEANSKIALGDAGAERLQGRGQMLAKLNGTTFLVQAPFIPDNLISEVIEAIRADNRQL